MKTIISLILFVKEIWMIKKLWKAHSTSWILLCSYLMEKNLFTLRKLNNPQLVLVWKECNIKWMQTEFHSECVSFLCALSIKAIKYNESVDADVLRMEHCNRCVFFCPLFNIRYPYKSLFTGYANRILFHHKNRNEYVSILKLVTNSCLINWNILSIF